MTKNTNDNYGETRDNPYQRVFLAFNNMINKNSDVWIKELLNAREPSLGYGEMAAIGLGMAAVFLFGGVATVASIASHNNNNSPTKPPAPGKRQ